MTPPAERDGVQPVATRTEPARDSFPATEISEIWPEVLRAVGNEVSRRRLPGTQASRDPLEQAKAAQFLDDCANTVRTKLAQDGAFMDFFVEEIDAIFSGAPVPRLGVATRVRNHCSFAALEAATQECTPLGPRYCIVLMAVRRTEYRAHEGKQLVQVVRGLPAETFFAMGIRPDESLPPETVRISVLTA